MTPQQRSRKYVKDLGGIPWTVEQWIAPIKLKRDLYNLFDLFVLWPENGTAEGIQVTTASNKSSHKKKMLANATLPIWLDCGLKASLHSWKKTKNRWRLTIDKLEHEQDNDRKS